MDEEGAFEKMGLKEGAGMKGLEEGRRDEGGGTRYLLGGDGLLHLYGLLCDVGEGDLHGELDAVEQLDHQARHHLEAGFLLPAYNKHNNEKTEIENVNFLKTEILSMETIFFLKINHIKKNSSNMAKRRTYFLCSKTTN